MPDEYLESTAEWSQKVTLIVTYDPATGYAVVDRGPLPPLFAQAILASLDDFFLWSDEKPPVMTEDEDAE